MTISRDQFDDAERLLTEGMMQREVARQVGISNGTVQTIAAGVHAYQSMSRVSKPKRDVRYHPPTPDPTPEEIAAQTWAVRFWWDAAKERKRRTGVTAEVRYVVPMVAERTLIHGEGLSK